MFKSCGKIFGCATEKKYEVGRFHLDRHVQINTFSNFTESAGSRRVIQSHFIFVRRCDFFLCFTSPFMMFQTIPRDPSKVIIVDWDDTILPSTFVDRWQVENFENLPLHVSTSIIWIEGYSLETLFLSELYESILAIDVYFLWFVYLTMYHAVCCSRS